MILSRRRFASLSFAAGLSPVLVHASEPADTVRLPIATLYSGLEAVMRAGRGATFQQRYDKLAPVIDQTFDLEKILSVSVGLRWNAMDDATRSALRAAFRRFTIASYVANFDSYEGQKFEIDPRTRASGQDEVVETRIVPGRGDPARLDYVMHKDGEAWHVVDILLDGTISRVAVQRSDFRALLARGDAAALIESLQRKTADLSGGTLGS